MRNRFLVVFIACLFATFSVFPFVAISRQECKQGVCAEGRVYGGSKLRAKARVSSTRSYDGRWTYSIKAGSQKESGEDIYRQGYSEKWEVSDYTATA